MVKKYSILDAVILLSQSFCWLKLFCTKLLFDSKYFQIQHFLKHIIFSTIFLMPKHFRMKKILPKIFWAWNFSLTKNLLTLIFDQFFFCPQIVLFQKWFLTKIFWLKISCSQKRPENSLDTKICLTKIFWIKIFLILNVLWINFFYHKS